jgi:hypothetical protein
MASTTTHQLTDEDRKKARASAEKARREQIKAAKDALERASLPADTQLSADQRKRAADPKKKGLTGKSLADWILEGKTPDESIQAARQEQKAAARAERTRENVTRSADPEASTLAVEAKSLAPEVKSAFLPKDAREFLDKFEVVLKGDTDIVIRRTDGIKNAEGEQLEVELSVKALEKFARKGEKIAEVRTALSTVGKDSRLWGRKLGLMALAQRLRRKGESA